MNCTYCQSPTTGDSKFCCHSCELLYEWNSHGVSPLNNLRVTPEKWQKYNYPELESTFNSSDCPLFKTFNFYVEGLQCSSCVHLLEDFPRYCNGVVSSRVDFSKSTLEVETQSSVLLGNVCEAISLLGYVPKPLKEFSDYSKAQQDEYRQDLKRIGIAAAVAGNVMLFSTPIYTGVTGLLAEVFKWLSFIIFLPVVTYLAVPFYKKAWASLLVRRINVDMMIVVALLAGFSLSTYALILGTDQIYFDSTSSFIFLILATRFFLKKNQTKLEKGQLIDDLFHREIYTVIDQGERKRINHSQIKSNDVIEMRANQLVPCDTTLENQEAQFDFSFLTGESVPQVRHFGEVIEAGSRLLSDTAFLKVQSQSAHSQLAVALARVEKLRTEKLPGQSIADLVSHKLTVVVFFIAVLFFILTFETLGIEAFKRCLALITIACPCAIAFGTPLANSLGLNKATKLGFFIRSESLFEKMGTIKKVIFDKTGTLTLSQMNFVNAGFETFSSDEKEIMLGLEKFSHHPVAMSLKAAWPINKTRKIAAVNEVAGHGVESMVDGHVYKLVKSSAINPNEKIAVSFFKDQELIDTLFFEEELRPEAKSAVANLKAEKFDIYMLTGDKRSRALRVGEKLGISDRFIFSEQTLDSKQQIISNLNPCLYVGDGINDVAGLTAASVGFAIKGPFESTFRACDVYAPQKNLNAIIELFALSKNVQKTVQANLAFALFYNLVGGSLALAGFVNPLVAAILMPISSFIITAHTVWRLK